MASTTFDVLHNVFIIAYLFPLEYFSKSILMIQKFYS